MIKLLIGGSPCTYWSVAQKNNRETEPSGMGWELFKNYLIAKEKFKPDFFLYENNKSAAEPIKQKIREELNVWDGTFLMPDSGARYIEINSALVSAQNRQRFYVHNCGDVQQPEDRGILLRDILETRVTDKEKAYCLKHQAGNIRDYFKKHHTQIAYEPVRIGDVGSTAQAHRVYSCDGKSVTINAGGGGQGGKTGLYACPYEVEELSDEYYHGNDNGSLFGKIVSRNTSNNKGQPAQCVRVYNTNNKSICLDNDSRKYIIDEFIECNYVEGTNRKKVPIYEVKDGKITIKGKQYPIKLKDGYYIIRKLTVTECCRLQTMPDDYCRAVSNSQAYKGLGNGWTASVIIHILNGALKDIPRDEEIVVLSMYDGIGTGRYCLDKMGFTNVKYYAYEIDKYAMQIAKSNYSDIIECGDAFQVRNDDWGLK